MNILTTFKNIIRKNLLPYILGVLTILIIAFFLVPAINFEGPQKTSLMLAEAAENGRPVHWFNAKGWIKKIEERIDKQTKWDKRKWINWDRRAIGWKVEAKLLRDLLNHQAVIDGNSIYAIDTVLIELGLRESEEGADNKFDHGTVIISGYSKNKIPGSIPEIIDETNVPNRKPIKVYRLLDFEPKKPFNPEDSLVKSALIEYVGPCNTCP